MAIDKNNKVEKAIKIASFIKDSMGKLKKIPNYSGLHAHVISIIDNGKVGLKSMTMTRLEKLTNIGLISEDSARVLIYSDQGVCWIKNVDGLNHQKEMDKLIDEVVSKPSKQINEFVAFVKDKYFALEDQEVDNEDFIRRLNGAYEVLNVQESSPATFQE